MSEQEKKYDWINDMYETLLEKYTESIITISNEAKIKGICLYYDQNNFHIGVLPAERTDSEDWIAEYLDEVIEKPMDFQDPHRDKEFESIFEDCLEDYFEDEDDRNGFEYDFSYFIISVILSKIALKLQEEESLKHLFVDNPWILVCLQDFLDLRYPEYDDYLELPEEIRAQIIANYAGTSENIALVSDIWSKKPTGVGVDFLRKIKALRGDFSRV